MIQYLIMPQVLNEEFQLKEINHQAAFGNMCRKGRMFAPIKVWRRWHRRVNIK
jgi:ribosomal protein L4